MWYSRYAYNPYVDGSAFPSSCIVFWGVETCEYLPIASLDSYGYIYIIIGEAQSHL